MNKSGVAHMLLYPSMVQQLAHHEVVISYWSLTMPDSHM